VKDVFHGLAQAGLDYVELGYFYSEQIHYLVEKYSTKLPGKQLGIHCHNNQQLAFANTIEGIIKNVNFVDGSIYGMGRAAGNCTTELLLGFLKNPKFNLRPVLDLVDKYFIRLKEELQWGYQLPYAVTGILNKHPRPGMAFMRERIAGAEGPTLTDFYSKLVEVEDID